MTADEIERDVMRAARLNAPDSPDNLIDAFLYLALFALYSAFYAGYLTRAQASPIKARMMRIYHNQSASFRAKECAYGQAHDWRVRMANTLIDYAQNRTLDNADRLWAAAQGLLEGAKPNGKL